MRGQSRLGPEVLLVTLMLGSGGLVAGTVNGGTVPHAPMSDPVSIVAPEGRFREATETQEPDAVKMGEKVYCQRCRTCHGDRGQGLTTEFRQLFPLELQDCWAGGCHGDLRYEGGFSLPAEVPPVIGELTQARFGSTFSLDGYLRAAMPYQSPGRLGSGEFDMVVTFLASKNHLPPGGSDQRTTTPSPPPTRTVERKPDPVDTTEATMALAASDSSQPGGRPLVPDLVVVGSAAALILLGLLKLKREGSDRH